MLMFYNAIIYYCNNCQFSFLRCHKLHFPLSLAVWGYSGPTHNTFQLYTSTQRLRSTRTLYHTYSTQGTRPRRSNITHHKHTKHGTGVTPAQYSTLHSFMQSYTSTQWFKSLIHHVIHTAQLERGSRRSNTAHFTKGICIELTNRLLCLCDCL